MNERLGDAVARTIPTGATLWESGSSLDASYAIIT